MSFCGYTHTIVLIITTLVSINGQPTYKQEPNSNENFISVINEQQKIINELKALSSVLLKEINDIKTGNKATEKALPRDCADLYKAGNITDGKYYVYTRLLNKPIQVYCDMTKNSGGWTVIERRQDGSVNFNRDWATYRNGFGNMDGEFWLGNEKIAALVEQKVYELYIYLEDFEGNNRYASYYGFYVAPEWDHFRLQIGPYTGNAGDSLIYQNSMKFSTVDSDNDISSSYHCAQDSKAGFWFKDCFRAGLNHPYRPTSKVAAAWYGIIWNAWHGHSYSLKSVVMKIRPVDFTV